jgi:hypothetical protein
MKKFLLFSGIFMGIMVAAQVCALEWWRLWMYHGWQGLPERLFKFFEADGEAAYDLIGFEMFLIVWMVLSVVFIVITLLIITLKFIRRSIQNNTRSDKCPLCSTTVSYQALWLSQARQDTTVGQLMKFDKISRFFIVMLIFFLLTCLDVFVILGCLLLYGGLGSYCM